MGKTIFTDRLFKWMVKDIRDVVGKYHRSGTRRKLMREAVLLKEKKKFQETFNSKQGTDDDGEVGNKEGMMTFSKMGKIFCESLVFCHDNKFWSSADKRGCLCLHND